MTVFNLLALDAVIVFLTIAIFYAVHDKYLRTVALLLFISVMKMTHGSLLPWAFLLFAIAAGPIGEIIMMRFKKTWMYKSPDFLGIPMWLPPLWVIVSVTISTVGDTLSP